MNNGNKIVHGLWIGKELTLLELLTLASFANCGHQFNLWLYDELETTLPDGIVLRNANEIIPHKKYFVINMKTNGGMEKAVFQGFPMFFAINYCLSMADGGVIWT